MKTRGEISVVQNTFVEIHGHLLKLYREATGGAPDAAPEAQDLLDGLARSGVGDGDPAFRDLLDQYRRLISLSAMTPMPGTEPAPEPGAIIASPPLPVVVTSINPFSRTDVQMTCFRKWQDLGFEVYTVNHGSEIEHLEAIGIPPARIIELQDTDTGLELFGKPVPRIVPTFEICRDRFESDVILVNSDIYPASNGTEFIDRWLEAGTALGIARRDVLNLPVWSPDFGGPYLGGLDCFMLTRAALTDLLWEFGLFKASERMCFGVVGWDYLTGALILERLGGTFLESEMLLHEKHKPTYTDIAEFAQYIPSIRAAGIEINSEFKAGAEDFAALIVKICEETTDFAIDCDPRSLPEIGNPQIEQAIDAAARLAPTLLCCYGRENATALAVRIAAAKERISDTFALLDPTEPERLFGHSLLVLFLQCRLHPAKLDAVTETYPDTSLHAPAIAAIRKETAYDQARRRVAIAQLFATELTVYALFNALIHDFLVLSCTNDDERALLAAIRGHLMERKPHAS